MRAKLLVGSALALTATSFVACTDITGLGYSNVSGSYELETFNGFTLPTISYQDGFEQHELLAETFTLYSDGTYTDDYTIRVSSRNGSSQSSHRDLGTFQQNNNALQFRDSATGDIFTGSITGNTLTVTQLGDTYVHRR